MSAHGKTGTAADHRPSGKSVGSHDFGGQPARSGEHHGDVSLNRSKQHNPHNGSGGSKKTIAPHAVHGSNR